jgi:hypothetical protein
MSLLKSLSNPKLLLLYEQYYIQTLQREGKLIPVQNPEETNPLFQAAINPRPLHPTRTNQKCSNLHSDTTLLQPNRTNTPVHTETSA